MTEDEPTPGERLRREILAAAAYAGVKGSEPALAEATKVSRKTLRRLFDGGQPDGETLSKIAIGLKTTPEALLAAREGRPRDGLEQIAYEIQRLRVALAPDSVDDELTQAGADAVVIAREDQPAAPEADPPSGRGASYEDTVCTDWADTMDVREGHGFRRGSRSVGRDQDRDGPRARCVSPVLMNHLRCNCGFALCG